MNFSGMVSGMPAYPSEWPEWAKDAAFHASAVWGYYVRGTSARLDDQSVRVMLADIITQQIDAMKEILIDTGKAGGPKTRYEAAQRYMRKEGRPDMLTIEQWARQEIDLFRSVRNQGAASLKPTGRRMFAGKQTTNEEGE